MKKWKKVLIWVASIIVILGVGGLFAANYAVDKLISSLSESLENEILNETMNETVDGAITEGTDLVAGATDAPVTDEGTQETDIAGETSTSPEITPDTNNGNSTGEGTKPSDGGYKAEVSIDKAKDVQEKITVGEKAQLTSVFLKELSMSDIKELQGLASGGLSVEDKKKARSIILDKLSPEQYDELIQIAKKYGMSQGKSYDQVIKEK
ncbi:TraB/GumN family protein [Paenibacillus luteus]|uniref:TraB/GumN family protein n=1 Tax=Paenibacillus luteus TaxID=2545753 RepID=UPI0011425389|nr:TraB/GumN family protein [Paenibacillus luteus]